MNIIITATGQTLESEIDPRFGRCKYFILINPETMKYTAIPNESTMASGGAGIQAAQQVVNTHATTVITGNIGPNAHRTLTAANITIITGATGTIQQTIQHYNNNKLHPQTTPTVDSHHGINTPGGTTE